MKVIFPDGLEINYPTACFVVTNDTDYTLYGDSTKATFIAKVPLTCIVQAGTGENRYINNIAVYPTVNNAIDIVLRDMQDNNASGYKLGKLKERLKKFDARTKSWNK